VSCLDYQKAVERIVVTKFECLGVRVHPSFKRASTYLAQMCAVAELAAKQF
jgi:hypothetical protein